jgi:prevent-host-death family protein
MLYKRAMRYSTSDLSRKSGDIIARALQGPVTITQRSKPRLVLLSVEEYKRLKNNQVDNRRAYSIGELPDELFEAAKVALEEYQKLNEP